MSEVDTPFSPDSDLANKPMQAAIYVNNTSDDETHTVDEKIKEGINHCENQGWEITFIYRDDDETSDETISPTFKELTQTAKKDVFDVIAFWDINQFPPTLTETIEFISDLQGHDIEFYSISGGIDTTSEVGTKILNSLITAVNDQQEMRGKRVEKGMQSIAKDHKWPNSSPPFGYNLTDDRKLCINEKEQAIITEIFDEYVKTKSMPAVAHQLNSEGITTRNGNEWSGNAIGCILRNEIYCGKYSVGKETQYVSEYQIISEETYEQATEIRNRYENEDGAKRREMELSRKDSIIKHMKGMYFSYLDELDV